MQRCRDAPAGRLYGRRSVLYREETPRRGVSTGDDLSCTGKRRPGGASLRATICPVPGRDAPAGRLYGRRSVLSREKTPRRGVSTGDDLSCTGKRRPGGASLRATICPVPEKDAPAGLAVMGENLILNMESKGFTVACYNRTGVEGGRFS
jgi:hypothetical protein